MQARQATTPPTNIRPVDGTDGFIFFWALLYLLSSLTSLGFVPALQGAWVGAGAWIDQLTPLAALLAQSTAIFTCVLLVHLALLLLRRGPPVTLWLLMALLGAGPILIVMLAQVQQLPALTTWLVAAVASLLWFLLALHRSTRPNTGAVWFWFWFVALAAKAMASANFTNWVGSAASGAAAWVTALVALGLGFGLFIAQVRSSPRPAWSAAGLMVLSFLLARTEWATGLGHIPKAVLLLGRTMSELRDAEFSALWSWQLALGLVVAFAFGARRQARGTLLGVLAVSLLLPLTPLSGAAFALGAFALARD